tara:strand:- start:3184 stop:4404 length:1221 start_codon:yes stop_codon:yes gene_type:complete
MIDSRPPTAVRSSRTWLAGLALFASVACASSPITSLPPEMDLGADVFVHHSPGPLVSAGSTGPRRFVEPLLRAYLAASVDPTSDLVVLEAALEAEGFGRSGSVLTRIDLEGQAPLLVATLLGSESPQDVVVVLVRTDGATGAADAGAVVEGARALVRAGRDRRSDEDFAPKRSLAFAFGTDPGASLVAALHDAGAELPLAAICIEAIDSPGDLSIPFVMDRAPDPGAQFAVFPDPDRPGTSLSWSLDNGGVGPTALNVLGRMALVDVGKVSRPWLTTEVPHRTGGPQDAMLSAGVPAIRFRHLQPLRKLTSHKGAGLNAETLTPEGERERATVTAVSAALALASAAPGDLDRWMDAALLEARLRRNAPAEEQVKLEPEDLARLHEAWAAWNDGVRSDIRTWCLGAH